MIISRGDGTFLSVNSLIFISFVVTIVVLYPYLETKIFSLYLNLPNQDLAS